MADFTENYDIVVTGAGIAGIAAAIQAKRAGKKTLLLEKTVLPGGLATTGLVYIYLPLCDGFGHQVSFGITRELLEAGEKYGPGKIPENWRSEVNAPEGKRLTVRFSPASYMLALDELLRKENVEVRYDTLVCAANVEKGRVVSIETENESGRGRIRGKCFIDASGTGIVLRRAGVPCLTGDNYLSMWALQYRKGVSSEFGENLSVNFLTTSSLDEETKLLASPSLLKRLFGERPPEEYSKLVTYRGIDAEKVNRFVRDSRRMLLETYRTAYEGGVRKEDFYPVKIPAMPQFRKIACVDGEYVLGTGENGKEFGDSVGLLADWRKSGPELVWELPFRTLYPKSHTGGILAAGRCTAARGDAWEITRVIPSAGVSGQVAGLAASMMIDRECEAWELDVKELQEELRTGSGFRFHMSEVL